MRTTIVTILAVLFLMWNETVHATNVWNGAENCPAVNVSTTAGDDVTAQCSSWNPAANGGTPIGFIGTCTCPGGVCPAGCSQGAGGTYYQWWFGDSTNSGYCPYTIVPGSGIETANFDSNGRIVSNTSNYLTQGRIYNCKVTILATVYNPSTTDDAIIQVDYKTITVPHGTSHDITVPDYSRNFYNYLYNGVYYWCDPVGGYCGSASCVTNVSAAFGWPIDTAHPVTLSAYTIQEDCTP